MNYLEVKKELKKNIKRELKEAFPGKRVSLVENSGGYTTSFTIRVDINDDELEKAHDIIKKYQDAGETDVYTDYYDYNFYYYLTNKFYN